MSKDYEIGIYADEEPEVVGHGAFPDAAEIAAKVQGVSGEVLEKNFAGFISKVEKMLSSSMGSLTSFSVKEVKVSVGVSGSGEFSLLGLTKASAELVATFEITLLPK